jgi:hypothetical protein
MDIYPPSTLISSSPSCVIVIPLHRVEFSCIEEASLLNCLRRLAAYNFVFVHKESLDLHKVIANLQCNGLSTKSIHLRAVPDAWLASVDSYNSMLLQAWFYRIFAGWDYILIVQLDAWILRDDLQYWLCKGYSYIGAPWTGHLGADTPDTGVGNGGLSLRCVRDMLLVLESRRFHFVPVFRLRHLAYRMALFRRYGLFPPSQRPFLFIKRTLVFIAMSFGWHNTLAYYRRLGIQEDHFLSYYAPLLFPAMRFPSLAEAAAFSIETNPSQTRDFYGIIRPFGCHAWEKHDRTFWIDTFPEEFAIFV